MEATMKKRLHSAEAVDRALVNARLEGIEFDEDQLEEFELFARGELTAEEIEDRVSARYARV